ncbi:methionine ABC transporter ATP-binding protein [Brevibacillus fulvus]|uniref:D-methionine transport system ATP-binding protein n=1 Tax=Brevibacillus fulvus TaxID=1125967 RepID=A0A938XYM7_9BACL|nr:methionine ABC transporter ATP-binding protein [Brevibacillus fulvus]MBM7588846.1 D-methionine transport system ATP-binding protein [Brevibacillus fulvus]
MVELIELSKTYQSKNKTVHAVDNISLKIENGEIFGIVGYSGAGKSSLLRCINMLEKPTSGQVLIDGTDITKLSLPDLRRLRQSIGMIFQHFNLIANRTVAGNIAYPMEVAGKSKAEIANRTAELLELVELSDKANVYPAQLSGGQKQRVGIARALANDPKLLLCDEATSALDPKTTRSILNLLKRINQQLGISIVLITHEMEVVKEICHRVAIMSEGKIVETGTAFQIFANPQEEITKGFVNSVLDIQLPAHLLTDKGDNKQLIKVVFKGKEAEEPIIDSMLRNFSVKANFLHARIDYIQDTPMGVFVLELAGDLAERERAIAFLDRETAGTEVIPYVS